MTAGRVDVRIHFDQIEDPATHSTLTARAYARHTPTAMVDAWWEVSVGPGGGPHMGRDIPTLRRWAWALHHLADALEQHTTHDTEPPAPDPQLTLTDAPINAGHTPTIRIGA